MEDNTLKRLKTLRNHAIKNVERGFEQLDRLFEKDNEQANLIDPGKLRQLIQATKDLTDLFSDEKDGKAEVSQIIKALEEEMKEQ